MSPDERNDIKAKSLKNSQVIAQSKSHTHSFLSLSSFLDLKNRYEQTTSEF